MASNLLTGGIANIIYKAAQGFFLDAVLTRDTRSGGTSYEPGATVTTQTFTCKALDDTYTKGSEPDGLVETEYVSIIILANSLATIPQSSDQITIRGKTYTILPTDNVRRPSIEGDPARATWTVRAV